MKKKLIIISGDPNSINSEIIYKSWKKLNPTIRKNIYLISSFNLLKKQFEKLKYKIKLQKVKNINEFKHSSDLKVIDIHLKFKNPFNVARKNASRFVLRSLDLGHKLSLDTKNVLGLINCSIDKDLLKERFIGVTEYLAHKCKIKRNTEVMLINNEKLSVSPITTHLNINKISRKLNTSLIIEKIKIINLWFKKNYKKKPSIAVLGLNPHNAEMKKNSEEKKIILPSILKLKKQGMKVEGPLVADTIFINNYKNFDVIVGMYHDQVIAPFKTLYKFNAVNLTLGLKYLRVSPDHGTATNIILRKKANPHSLIKCIKTIIKFG
tara:strand:+ start:39 stop:1004 length:966 start_codon:yes stop_codon:yes gene_type:complete